MAHTGFDAERRAEEGRGQFGAQFLAGIGGRPEPTRLVVAQPRTVPGPMAQLVKRGAVVVDLLVKGGDSGQAHPQGCNSV